MKINTKTTTTTAMMMIAITPAAYMAQAPALRAG
jgi:hypothetical protein